MPEFACTCLVLLNDNLYTQVNWVCIPANKKIVASLSNISVYRLFSAFDRSYGQAFDEIPLDKWEKQDDWANSNAGRS